MGTPPVRPRPSEQQTDLTTELKTNDSFVLVEPGFRVRKDKLELVAMARNDVRRARKEIAVACVELLSLARARGVVLGSDSPLATLTQAADQLTASAPTDASRMRDLLQKVLQESKLEPAGYPFACYTPPAEILDLLDAFARMDNPIERRIWEDLLSRELRIAPNKIFDAEAGDGSTVVEQEYYPSVIAKLEEWIVRKGPLRRHAFDLLTARLSKSIEHYGQVAARLGDYVINDIATGTGEEFRAGGFLRAHMTPELRMRLHSRLLQTRDDTEFLRLANVIPLRPNMGEAKALTERALAIGGDGMSSLLPLVTDRWASLMTLAKEDPGLRENLERLDRTILAAPETMGEEGSRYLVARLQLTPVGEKDGEALYAALRTSVGSLKSDRARTHVAGYLYGLKTPEAPSIVSTMALVRSDQASDTAIGVLVKFVCEDRIPTADAELAAVLDKGDSALLATTLKSLGVQASLPKGADRTLGALRNLAAGGATSAEIQQMARQVLEKAAR